MTETLTATGFIAPLAPEPELSALWGRAIASDEDRMHWKGQRRTRITGTDACVIGRSRPQTVREHMRKKATGEDNAFSGNKATEWGNYREACMIDALAGSGWHRFGLLVTHPENDRVTATPDLVSVNFDGEIELLEMKTSAKLLEPGSAAFKATRYLEQILQQLLVTGAARVRLRVEQHDDDWSRWGDRPNRTDWAFADGSTLDDYGPRVVDVHDYVFERIDYAAELEELMRKNVAALVILDEELTGFVADGPEEFDPVQQREIGVEARRYADGMAAEKHGKAEKTAAQSELLDMLKDRKAFSERFDNIKVTYAPAAEGELRDVADIDAAKAANPEIWARVEAAEAALEAAAAGPRAALTAARDQWASVLTEHRKTERAAASPAKVTITPPKKG